MNASKKIIFIWFMRAVLKLSNKNIYIIQIKKYKKTENPERENYKKIPLGISYLGHIQKTTIICIFSPNKTIVIIE